jgi:hypothetical protein
LSIVVNQKLLTAGISNTLKTHMCVLNATTPFLLYLVMNMIRNVKLLPSTFDPSPFTLLRPAHKNSLVILFQSLASRDFITIQRAFETLKPDLNKVMLNLLSIYRGVKVRIFLENLMEKDDPNKRQVVPFSNPALLFTSASSEIITSKLELSRTSKI